MGLDRILLVIGEEDPCFFSEYFLGIHLNPFNQRALLSFLQPKKEILWVTSNQVGKTVTLAVAHLWFNFFKKGFSGSPELIERARYETLNISPVSRQSAEAFRYVEEILHSNFGWEEGGKRYVNKCRIEWFWESKNENLGRVDFSNSSSLWCLSTSSDQASGLAGKQFGFISYDECVQSHHLEDELGARIYSRTAKYSGWVVLVSTPDDLAKSQQYWYHLYTDAIRARDGEGESHWFLVTGVYDENIFFSKEIKEEFKKRLKKVSPARYNQVIKGHFLDAANRMFPLKVIEGMWTEETVPSSPREMIMVGGTSMPAEYVEIIDWGVADAGDETVIGIADLTDFNNVKLVHAWSKQGGDPIELMAMAGYLNMQFNDCPLVMDVSEMGGVIFKKMMKQFKPITFGQGNKADALFYLQLRLRNNIRPQKLTSDKKSAIGKLKSYYLPKLERQLSTYKLDDKKLKQDWVMMLAMLAWYLEKYKQGRKAKVFSLTNFYKK